MEIRAPAAYSMVLDTKQALHLWGFRWHPLMCAGIPLEHWQASYYPNATHPEHLLRLDGASAGDMSCVVPYSVLCSAGYLINFLGLTLPQAWCSVTCVGAARVAHEWIRSRHTC